MGLMNALGDVLGTNNSFSAVDPSKANLINPTNQQQLSDTYHDSRNAIQQQQSFANALLQQNGAGNQANVFGQMQGLAGQLQAQASGLGPNPALSQLQQTTSQNMANQAALMAGQRGTGANAGLMARQIGNQGANIQQQAVGQAATMGAQQQIAAQQALMGQQANMAGLAGQQVGQQAGALGSLNQFHQGLAGQQQTGAANYNSAQAGMFNNNNTINASVAAGNQATNAKMIGGAMNAAGAALALAHGGTVPNAPGSPMSRAAQYLRASNGAIVPGTPAPGGDSLKHDTVPAMLSPGEIVIPKSVAQSKNAGDAAKKFVEALLARQGKGA